MKFSTTTSSILCASMALSPSLAAVVPAGSEAPPSPNPGSSNVRQFPSSPVFDGEHSPLMNRSPALRTGHGSPRRSIPSRLLKVHQRSASAPDASPLDGLVDPLAPVLKPVGSIVKPIAKPLQPITGSVITAAGGLPVIGGPVQKVATGLGLSGAQVGARSVTPSQSTGDPASSGDDTTDSEPETIPEKPSGDDASKTSDVKSSSSSYHGLGVQAEIIGAVPGALVIEFPSGEVDTVAYGESDNDKGQDGSGPDSPASDSPPSSPTSPDHTGGDSAVLLAARPTSSVAAKPRVKARSSTPSQSPGDLTSSSNDKAHSESPEKSSDGDAAESSDDESSYYTGLGIQAEIIGTVPGALIIEFPSGEVDTVAYGESDNDKGQDGSGPDSPASDSPPSSPTSPDHTGGDSAVLLAARPTSSVVAKPRVKARSSTPSQSPGDLTSSSNDKAHSESPEKSSDGDAAESSDDESSYYTGLGIQAEIIGTVPGALIIEFPSGEVDTVAYGESDNDKGQDGSMDSGPDSPEPDAPPSSPTSPDHTGSDSNSAALLAVRPTSLASSSAALPTPSPVSSTIGHALAAVFSSLPGSSTFSHPSAPSQPASQLPSHSPTLSSHPLTTPSHPSDTAASVAAVSPLPSHSQSVNLSAQPSPEAAVLSSGHQASVPTNEDITVTGSIDGSLVPGALAGQS